LLQDARCAGILSRFSRTPINGTPLGDALQKLGHNRGNLLYTLDAGKAKWNPGHGATMAPAPSPTIVTSGPQLGVETKFMQSFRVSAPVGGGPEVVSVRNGQGELELFTIGPDNTIWNFYPDPASDTGFTGISTGVAAGPMAAGVDGSGRMVLVTEFNFAINYIYETGNPTSRWSDLVQVVALAPPANVTSLTAFVAANIANVMYVAAIFECGTATGPGWTTTFEIQDATAAPVLGGSWYTVSQNCVWLGNSAQTASLAGVGGPAISVTNMQTGHVTALALLPPLASLSVSTALDQAGNNQTFAVLADGNLYHLVSSGASYQGVQLSQGMSFRQVVADADGAGTVQVFAVSGTNVLYHFEPDSTTATGYDMAAPLLSNAALAAATANDAGDVELFVVGTANATLTHLIQQEVSGNWQAQNVEMPTGSQVEEYISYSSDVTVYDAAGALAVNIPVSIWTSEESRLTVNGATYFVDPGRPALTSTNAVGVLAIAQETDTLSSPAVLINIPSLMPAGQSVTIEQAAGVQQTLATITGQDLMSATDASGAALIPAQFRNAQNTNSLASAFNQCMALAEPPPSLSAPRFRRGAPKPGVWIGSAESAGPRRIAPQKDQHWQITFGENGAEYQELTAAEAASLVSAKRATLSSPEGILDWLSDVGDFLQGVAQGAIQVVNTIVTAVGSDVQAVFTIVVNAVTYAFDAVIQFVEQAFDVVQAFFAQVLVVFEKAFEYLGFVFNWADILLTQQAIAYTLNQFFGFLGGAAGGIQGILDNGISNLQSQIATLFNNAVQQIAGTSSIGGYDQANQQSSPVLSSSVANNPIYNGFINNAGSATATSATLAALDTSSVDNLIQQLTAFAAQSVAGAAFASAVSYFQDLGGSPDQIFTKLLAGMFQVVQGVIQAILSGVKAVIDAVLGLVQTLVTALQAVLNAEWNIPFVSDFYSWITNGTPLTTTGLFALVAAIPTTIIYKIVEGQAPFADQTAVNQFEALFTSQTMLQASGLATSEAEAKAAGAEGGLLSGSAAVLVSLVGCVSTCFYAAFSAVLDVQPPLDVPTPLTEATSQAAFVAEALAQACSFPWFTSSAAPDCTTIDGKNASQWIYQSLGVILDLVYLVAEDQIPENWNDTGVEVAFLYGLGDLTMALIASVGQSGWPVAANILATIPGLAKILRLQSVVVATKGISLVVVAGCDVVFLVSAAVINFVESMPSDNQPQLAAAT
jgi:hypothetical protein